MKETKGKNKNKKEEQLEKNQGSKVSCKPVE